MAFLEGFAWGYGMIVILGPVFFTLMKAALESGIPAGLSVAAGIILSDIIVVLACYLGFSAIIEDVENQFWVSLAGGIILLAIGLKFLIKPQTNTTSEANTPKHALGKYFMQGFLVNFVNPSVFFIWIALIAYARSKFGTNQEVVLMLVGVLSGIFAMDLTKVFLAEKLRKIIEPHILSKVFRVIGIVLIGFGIHLLWNIW